MTTRVEVYYSLISPWTYMVWARLGALARQSGAEIAYHPLDTNQVFPRTGGLPLAKRAPERQRYRMMELKRWRRRLAIPLTLEPRFFPTDVVPATKMALAIRERGGDVWAFSDAVLRAVWVQDRDIADVATLKAISLSLGLDAEALLTEAQDLEDQLAAEAEQAIAKGIFGAPSFIVGEEIFWGQDRFDFLAEAVTGQEKPTKID